MTNPVIKYWSCLYCSMGNLFLSPDDDVDETSIRWCQFCGAEHTGDGIEVKGLDDA